MKKWLYIIPLILIIIIWQASQIYLGSMSYQKKEENKAIAFAKENVKELSSITDAKYYHGRLAYTILYGTNEKDEELIIWVPNSKKGRLIVKKASEGWSKEKVKKYIIANQNPLKLIDIRLGAEVIKDNRTNKTETTPLWEITYIDQEKRYTYYFMKFTDGSFVKRYSLKKDRFEEEN
ncbi:MAG TPA: DUF5590 domain-containing protein [Bacillus bacterium]|nr:DUF5590 domain-containing protein [Bacillus sp. (in: firmicutes)]